MENKPLKSYWEWVMFDSTTGATHCVICHNCRKPKKDDDNDFCRYCGAVMRKDNG